MTGAPAPPSVSASLKEHWLSTRSDQLAPFRELLQQWEGLAPLLGQVAVFRVVVDTNVVLGDLIWLCGDRKNPLATTALIEAIEAETVEAYAPEALFNEVEEKIPLIAAQQRIPEERLREEWAQYEQRIYCQEPSAEVVQVFRHGVDPDDAFFLALAQEIDACGVISKDRHIEAMGGNRIVVECAVSLRDYSRALAVSMNIRLTGVVLTQVGIEVVRGAFLGIRAVLAALVRAPAWVQLLLLGCALWVACNPKARKTVSGLWRDLLAGSEEFLPLLLETIGEAALLARQYDEKAEEHRQQALKGIDGP